jgi:hypothetical protein
VGDGSTGFNGFRQRKQSEFSTVGGYDVVLGRYMHVKSVTGLTWILDATGEGRSLLRCLSVRFGRERWIYSRWSLVLTQRGGSCPRTAHRPQRQKRRSPGRRLRAAGRGPQHGSRVGVPRRPRSRSPARGWLRRQHKWFAGYVRVVSRFRAAICEHVITPDALEPVERAVLSHRTQIDSAVAMATRAQSELIRFWHGGGRTRSSNSGTVAKCANRPAESLAWCRFVQRV